MTEWHKSFASHSSIITNWLYVGALLFHLIWFFWVISSAPIAVVIDFSHWLVDLYSAIGFKWTLNVGSTLIAAGMLSAVFVNILRRVIEGIVLGWPRFNDHDASTLRAFTLKAVGYGLLCFLGLGSWGANMSENFVKLTSLVGYSVDLSLIDIAVISVGTFLIGSFVNILDDVISSIAIHIFRRL